MRQQLSWSGNKYLDDAHSESIAQNFVSLGIVAVANRRGQDEQLERVVFVDLQFPLLPALLHLPHPLLPVAVAHRNRTRSNYTS